MTDFATILTKIITLITSGFTAMAEGIGTGLSSLITHIFFITNVESGAITDLSVFGYVTIIFAGIGLCVGLSKLVVKWLGSLGGSKM